MRKPQFIIKPLRCHLISHLLSEMSSRAVCAAVLLITAIADFSSAGGNIDTTPSLALLDRFLSFLYLGR